MTQPAEKPDAPARSEAPRAARKINWDVIRVVAVFAVVVQHATHASRINHPELGPVPLSFPLQIGASALVIISAYFACATLSKGHPGTFLRGRLARLLPPYLAAVLITYLVLVLFSPPGWTTLVPRDLVFNLLMLQNWVPGVRFVDYSYWTLPVQLFGFLAAAALFAGPLGSGRGLRVVLWLLPVVPLLLRLWVDELAWLSAVYLGFALHRVHLFAVGVALYLWSRNRLSGWQAAALGATALYAHSVHSADLASTAGIGVLLAAMALAAVGPDWNAAPLRPFAGVIRWLAGISYGIYLLNQELGYLLMYQVRQLGGSALAQVAAAGAAAVLSGWLLTRWVERPAHRALMRPGATDPIRRWLRWLVFGAQPMAGSVGRRPARPLPSPRPVSHSSSSAADPLTVDPSLLLLTSQLR